LTDALSTVGRWIANPRYFLLEEAVLLCLLAAAAAAPWLSNGLAGIESAAGRFARRQRLACVVGGLAPVLLRILLLPLFPVPQAQIHDEFSLLLGADTFAHGRVTNPSPTNREHFETFHTLVEPTYMSIYPPAQALVLGAGQVLGHPWIGVLITVASMGAAITWMLQGWLPPGWALLGGVLAGARYGLFSYWVNSYWGGALAAAGGAIVLGVAGRVWRRSAFRPSLGVMAGLGAAILVNRRPYEGAVLCASAAALILVRWSRSGKHRILPFSAGASAVLTVALAAVLYFNWRVTGSPVRMPYVEGIERYGVARHLIVLPSAPEPSYRHATMRNFYRWEMETYRARRTRPITTFLDYAVGLWTFYAGPSLSVAFLGIAALWRSRRIRPLLAMGLAALVAASLEVWLPPHYAAPWTALGVALLVAMLRHLHYTFRSGAAIVRACVVCAFGMLLLPVASQSMGWQWPATFTGWWHIKHDWDRREVERRVLADPGKHLVVVRYLPGHNLHDEYVFNGADLDGPRVVWARSLGPDKDRRLIEYYGERKSWLLEAGEGPVQLFPYKVPVKNTD